MKVIKKKIWTKYFELMNSGMKKYEFRLNDFDIEVGSTSLEKSRIGGIAHQPNMLSAFFCYYMFLPLGFFLLNMRFLIIRFFWIILCVCGILLFYYCNILSIGYSWRWLN